MEQSRQCTVVLQRVRVRWSLGGQIVLGIPCDVAKGHREFGAVVSPMNGGDARDERVLFSHGKQDEPLVPKNEMLVFDSDPAAVEAEED